MALASAVATLLGALFLCLSVGDPAERHEHERAAPHAAPADRYVQYACPYERGDCSLFPALSPAVLSAPPLDPPLQAEGRLTRPEASPADGGALLSGAGPRAPDLHVLQVLRT
ncbi:hypothetical protein [Streptomyces roseicoloratus]|uniref:hypothetical protein n=1 Tax=Streptomyces roseicoloratus TaxID=2508722 RepID=UPI001FE64F44|nr:hypothetical protein [Streptomyces roseicoloratus]